MQCLRSDSGLSTMRPADLREHAPVEFEMTHDEVWSVGSIQMRQPCRPTTPWKIMICWRRPRPRGRPHRRRRHRRALRRPPMLAPAHPRPSLTILFEAAASPRVCHHAHQRRRLTPPSTRQRMATSMPTFLQTSSAAWSIHLPRRCPDRRFRQPHSTMVGSDYANRSAFPRLRRATTWLAVLARHGRDHHDRRRFVEKLDFVTTPAT